MWRLLVLSTALFLTIIIVATAPAPASIGCDHLGDSLGRAAAPLDNDSYRLPPNFASRVERSL